MHSYSHFFDNYITAITGDFCSRSNIDSNNSVIIDESFNYENICN